MDYLFYLFVILAFLAVVMFLEGSYLAWNAYRGPEARRIERRLLSLSATENGPSEVRLLKKRLLSEVPAIDRFLLTLPRIHAIDRWLLQSGLNLTVAAFLGVGLALIAFACAVGSALGAPWWMVLALAAVVAAAWAGYIQHRRMDRMHTVENQLPDALELMAHAMQAGHAFPSALRMVGTEGPAPISSEFQTVFDEINFGVSTQVALSNLSRRVPSTELRYFVIASLIQRETGGNLADLLNNIARLVRERQKLAGTVRVLSSEGRLSAWILGILPFALTALITVLNPRFIRVLWTDPAGIYLVVMALSLMLIGIVWLWQTVQVRA